MPLVSTVAGLAGLILGSFLNVVAHRLPRGESFVAPRSRCPGCETPIKPYDNIPVLSWLALRGRCRTCRTRISWRYPLVELLTGLLLAAVVLVKGADAAALPGLVFVLLLVPIAAIDVDHQIIPNKLTLAGAVLGPLTVLVADPGALPSHLIAGAAAGGFLLLALLAYPSGMGMGDVKLAGVMGLFLGVSVVPAMFVGFLLGTVVGGVVTARKGRRTRIPFGPFLAAGAVVGLLAGPQIVHWYLHTFA
jgi:leader peptidase (prepilin peptidase)/N-methyltransferase